MNIGKKLLSLLTVFCLTLSLVPTVALAADATSIWFGYRDTNSVTLNSTTPYLASNSTQAVATQPNEATGYAYFTNGTLTLHNYNNSSTAGIFSGYYDLTIKLEGTNSIKSSDNGICTYKNLTISGPGSLSLTAAGNGTTVYAGKSLTINNGAKVSAPSGQNGQSFHVDTSNGRIIITGAGTEVNAIDGTYKRGIVRSGTINYDEDKYNGTIEVSDGAKLKATQIEGTLIVDGENSSLDSSKNEVSSNPVKKYVVSGKVTDGTSDIVGASVQLCSTTGTANANASAVISTSTTTGNDGTYSFSNVPAGKYTITASKEGYSASTGASVNVTVNNADVTTGTDLTLSLIKYNVYVNGIQVTGINKDNVLSDSGIPTVVYTPAGEGTPQKLTLNDAKIVNGIKASDDLMIDLTGKNTINGTSNAIYLYRETTEATSPKLTITSNQSGTLSMTSSNASTTVYVDSDITINGSAKVNATINGTAQAIHSPNGNIIIEGTAEVIATNEHSTTSTTNSIAVLVGADSKPFGTIEVKDSASLKAQGHGKALGCTTFTYPANGYVAKGSTDYEPTNLGEYLSNNLATYKYVEVKHEGATPTTFDVTLTNGTGYTLSAAQGSRSPVTSGGSYSFTLDIADSYKRGNNFAVKANGSELTAGADGKYTISNIRENQTITVEGVVEITKYQVWVNGTQVTEANKDNVLQDNTATHSVVYAPAYGNNPATLTLTNASIKNQQTSQSGELPYILPCGIAAKENLKVIVYGENNIIESANGNAIRGEDDLTICGNGFLQLTSYNTAVTISVQDSHNLAVTENVKITATKKNSNNQLDGRTIAANDVTVQGNANVTAINETNNRAVYCSDKLKVTDSATLIAQSKQNSYAIYTANGFTYPGHIVKASKNSEGNEPDTIYDPAKLTPEGNETAYKYVQVSPTSGTVITGIKLNKELSMKVGATETLTPVFTPTEPSEKTVTWTSSDETIATVEQNGKVTAVGLGTATITVLTKDGGYTDTCTVTVSNSSSSSGSHTTYYPVNTSAKGEGGSVVVSPKSASKGSAVTVTVTPESGYQVSSVQAVDKDGKKLTLTDKGDGKYTFVMPGSKVEVSASFAQVQKPEEPSPYRDVSKDSYYYDAVQWASDKGITNGVADGVFAPDWVCTRGQIVTFLWRSVGSPAPKTAEMPFADVAEDAYYAQAVLWAVENGITKGTSETTFSPDQTCTRAHAVAFLYRLAGSPAVTGSSFQDVAADAYYNAAVAWAVQQGITKGTSETTFSPNETCTRAQIVTFLYRMNQAK